MIKSIEISQLIPLSSIQEGIKNLDELAAIIRELKPDAAAAKIYSMMGGE